MPVGVCDHCQHRFVIEDPRSLQRVCPRCLHPMRVTPSPGLSPDPLPLTPASARRVPLDRELKCLNGVPLEMTELGQQVLELLALSACLREEAEERMRESRELAEKRAALKGSRQ